MEMRGSLMGWVGWLDHWKVVGLDLKGLWG